MTQWSGLSLGVWENPALAFTVPHPSCVSLTGPCSVREWGQKVQRNAQPLFWTWGLTTSLGCPHPPGILGHFLLCLNTFDSALTSFLPGCSGSPPWAHIEHMLKHPCPVYSFILQHSCLLLHPPTLGSQMDLKAQICSLLSMVLVLASYQSVFYYKMLTHSFYMYFKLWGRKKEGAGVDTFFTALWVYGRALRGKKINPRS